MKMVLRADSDQRPTPPRRRREADHPVRHGHSGQHGPAHRRYSRFVGFMKVVLPALAVVVLGLVVAWPRLSSDDERFKVGFASISPQAVESLQMINARYYGIDKHNRPFTVTADLATEQAPASGMIVLDHPKADFTTEGGAGVYVEAIRGHYNQKSQMLDLEGEVSLFHDQGYELHTEKARIDLTTSLAEGHEPVTGNGPQGRIDGQGFRIFDKGKQIMVLGRSNLNLKGAKSK